MERNGEGIAQKKSDQDSQNKIASECENDSKQIQYNPAIHSIKTQNDFRSKKRFRKRVSKRKRKERQLKKN